MELFKIFGTLALLGVGDVNRQLDDVTGKGKNSESILTQAFHKVGRAVASAFTAEKIIQFGKDVVETAGRSQASFAKVTTLLDTSKINVDKYYQSVKKGANESGISIADFSEALYQSLSASVDAGDAVNFTTKAVKLAKAGFTDASTAVDVMTTAINAYGLSAKDADHISDDLITTQNLGKTTVDQLAQSMGRVIPTASAYGVNIDNLCSSYAIMTKSGIQTSEATTYLKGMLDELGDSGSQVSSILQSKTGKSFTECMKSGMSLGDVLQVLYDACGDNSTAFANLWSSQEAGTGALSLVNAGAKEFNGTLDKMQHNAGATSSAYEKVENTFEAKLERLKNKFNNFKSDLGEGALPVIGKLVDGLSSLLGWVDKHIKQIKALALAIGGAVATFAALKAALAIAAAIKTFVTAISMATSATALLKGAMIALSATFPISTMGLVIIAIAALVGAFIYLWNTSDSFRNFWINLWNGIKTVVITVVNAVKNFLTGAWDGITSATEQMWNGVKDFFTGLWNGIKNVFTTVVGGIGSFLSGAWSGITSGISTAWSAITNVFTTVWDTIKNVIQVALEFIRNLIVGWFQIVTIPWRFIWENFGDDIITAWDGIKNVISNALDAIRTVISTVWNAIKTIIEPIVNGIRAVIEIEWNGIKIVTTTVFNAVKTVITTIWNGISAFISSVLNIIKSVFSSVWNSIQTAVTNVVNAIRTVITNTMNAIRSVVTSILNGIKSVFSSVWNGIKSVVSNVINGIRSTISNGLNAARNVVTGPLNAIKNAFSNTFNAAKQIVSNAINRIKSVMHFSWSLPHLKLPHIHISGGFKLNPPSAPHFSVSWYKKAMEQPFLFTQPTLFDMNPATGQAKGAGEAGDEVMYGKNALMADISAAVSSQNDEMISKMSDMFNRVLNVLEEYFPQFANTQMILDSGTLVGEIAPEMSHQLGVRAKRYERGE